MTEKDGWDTTLDYKGFKNATKCNVVLIWVLIQTRGTFKTIREN